MYFPALVALCAERKAANLERWRQFGEGKCGVEEKIIKGVAIAAPVLDESETAPAAVAVRESKEVEGEPSSGERDSGLSLDTLTLDPTTAEKE